MRRPSRARLATMTQRFAIGGAYVGRLWRTFRWRIRCVVVAASAWPRFVCRLLIELSRSTLCSERVALFLRLEFAATNGGFRTISLP